MLPYSIASKLIVASMDPDLFIDYTSDKYINFVALVCERLLYRDLKNKNILHVREDILEIRQGQIIGMILGSGTDSEIVIQDKENIECNSYGTRGPIDLILREETGNTIRICLTRISSILSYEGCSFPQSNASKGTNNDQCVSNTYSVSYII